ncbi:MAG TPA: hypothetical protein VIR59_07060 [Gaiellaceae bacterium]|jgi:hypothetical protein
MNFTITLVLAAFLLAIWSDARFEQFRPQSTRWRIVHVALACVLLQLGAVAAGSIITENAGAARQLVGVLALLLPVFVYTFVSGLWLLRTLAEVGFARR